MLSIFESRARNRPPLVYSLAPLIFVCLHSLCVHTIGQISRTPERKESVSPSLVTAQDPLSTSKTALSAREMRIRTLAGRIAAADSETAADALLQAESDLTGVELGRALLVEILRLRNTPISRDNLLKVSLRLLRYTERSDMSAARALAQRGLGVTYENLGKWELAEQHLSTAISLFVKLGPRGRHDLMWASRDLASVYHRKGDARRAAAQYETARRLARENNDRESVIQACHSLAAVYLQARDFPSAYAYLEQGLSVAETLPDKGPKLATLVQLANTFLAQGRISKAIEAQENAYKTAIEAGSPAHLTYLFQTADLYVKLGDFPAAYTRFRKVLAASEKSGDQGLYFLSLLNIAKINEQYGREKKAAELYQRV